MKRFAVTSTAVLAMAAMFFMVRAWARPSDGPRNSPSELARGLASQKDALNGLQAKVDRLASLVDTLAAKIPDPEDRNGMSQSADSLERQLSSLSARVDSLQRQLAQASAYSDQIDRSLLGIDTKASTPAVLNHRLDRLQKAVKPQ